MVANQRFDNFKTPEHFAQATHVRVVNGFRLREVVAAL